MRSSICPGFTQNALYSDSKMIEIHIEDGGNQFISLISSPLISALTALEVFWKPWGIKNFQKVEQISNIWIV